MLHVQVGQGHGERNILETGIQLGVYMLVCSACCTENHHLMFLHPTGKFTNTEKAQQVKAGILLWTKKPIMSKMCAFLSTYTKI